MTTPWRSGGWHIPSTSLTRQIIFLHDGKAKCVTWILIQIQNLKVRTGDIWPVKLAEKFRLSTDILASRIRSGGRLSEPWALFMQRAVIHWISDKTMIKYYRASNGPRQIPSSAAGVTCLSLKISKWLGCTTEMRDNIKKTCPPTRASAFASGSYSATSPHSVSRTERKYFWLFVFDIVTS